MKSFLPSLAGLIFFSGALLYSQTGHSVSVANFSFTPSSISINVGDTVIWNWVGGTHTTTSDSTSGPNSWNSAISSSNKTYRHVITTPGTHRFYCMPHGGPGGTGMSGMITATAIDIRNDDVKRTFNLCQNYPNPFNPSTTLKYTLFAPGVVSLKIYNIIGQEVISLFEGYQPAGEFTLNWNGTDNNGRSAHSGIYIYRLEYGSSVITRKMTLIK